jgi:hypothetical protein
MRDIKVKLTNIEWEIPAGTNPQHTEHLSDEEVITVRVSDDYPLALLDEHDGAIREYLSVEYGFYALSFDYDILRINSLVDTQFMFSR